jgi:hypothetical protein
MAGSRREPHRLRRRRNRWRVHQRICLGPALRARAQSSSMPPPLPTSSGSDGQQGQEPDRTRSIMRRRDAMPTLACFLVHVSCQQAPAATDTFSAVRSQHVHDPARSDAVNPRFQHVRPASGWRPAGRRRAGRHPAGVWPAGVWLLKGSSRPGRPPPRRPCACPGGGSGTGRAAGLRHPGPPSRR